MSKRRYEDYENVSADVIRKAYKGDNEAMSRIIAHYQNYGRKCFRTIASTVFDLDLYPSTISVNGMTLFTIHTVFM